MSATYEFVETGTDRLVASAAALKEAGMRFMACHAQRADEGRFDLTYAFVEDATGRIVSLQMNIASDEVVPSVGSLFPVAFMFENEMHDLYGVNVDGITIDFDGQFYHLHIPEPMAAAPEKAQKAARAAE